MSSVQCWTEFVVQRLTAAAEQISRDFGKSVVEYEEEIDRQRRLLDVVWRPERKLHRTELPQQHVCQEEEVLSEQERSSSLDQEEPEQPTAAAAAEEKPRVTEDIVIEFSTDIDHQRRLLDIVWRHERTLHRTQLPQQHVQEEPEPPQLKEEQEEPVSSQGGEQLVLKQETETFMLTPTCEHSDQQLLSHNTPVAESHDQRGSEQLMDNSPPTKSHCNTHTEFLKTLTAAAELIFIFFEKTVVEYKDKINRQRRLLDICLKPEIRLHRTKTMLWSPGLQSEVTQYSEPEPNSDQQLLSHNTPVAESHDQRGSEHVETGSTRNEETKRKKRRHNNTSHSDNVDNSSSTKSHCNTRKGKKYFKCVTCGKDFQHKYRLVQHLRIHTGENRYSCETCGKGFNQNSKLKKHLTIHTGEKSYRCDTCGKRFNKKTNLQQHKTIHTGEKPHACKTCGKSFRTRAEMSIHTRTHTGEKPFSCNICEKTFSDPSGFIKHKRIHTGQRTHLCKICRKRFVHYTSLKRHSKIHTGEKPYICKNCGSAFRQHSGLKVHMRTHTGEKPYLCKACGKSFSQTSSLKRHMGMHE